MHIHGFCEALNTRTSRADSQVKAVTSRVKGTQRLLTIQMKSVRNYTAHVQPV